jgi:hypothetical protein
MPRGRATEQRGGEFRTMTPTPNTSVVISAKEQP